MGLAAMMANIMSQDKIFAGDNNGSGWHSIRIINQREIGRS